MQRFWVLTQSILKMMLREREALIGNLLIPAGLMLVLGAMGGSTGNAVSVAAWLMAGALVHSMMASGLGGDMNWLTTARDRGILLRVRATPLPPIVLVGAYVLVRLLLVLAQCALILLIAVSVFQVQLNLRSLPLALAIIIGGGLVFLILGQAIAAAAPNAGSAAVIANIIFFALLFTSKIVTTAVPPAVEQVARWTPAYMTVDLLRPALINAPADQVAWLNLVGLIGYTLLAIFIAGYFFRWEPKR